MTTSVAAFHDQAASFVSERVRQSPSAVLALPTGSSPVGMYRELVRRVRDGVLDLSRTVCFNLDEYLGLGPDHPQSYAQYMQHHLFGHVRVGRHHIPDGLAADPDAEARRYEERIVEAGGFDLAILGLGPNGHIGFNEPGSPPDSRTRVVELSPATRRANSRFFGSVELVPRRAITVGIGTILEAREILLLAIGQGKERVLRAALEGPVTAQVPASFLQRHPRVTVLVTPDLARRAGIGQHVSL